MTVKEFDFIIGFNQVVQIVSNEGVVIYLGKWGTFISNREYEVIDVSVVRDFLRVVVR